MEALDLPEEPRRPEHVSYGTDRAGSRDIPDPDARERAFEAAQEHASGQTRSEAEPAQRCEMSDQSSYWEDVPRFREMWADHEKRWPAESRTPVERPADPPGLDAAVAKAADRICGVEPRVSADVLATGRENDAGGWLEGFDFRLKGEDRLKEKAAEKMGAEPGMSAAEVLDEVADAIRFTYCFEPESYAKGYYGIREGLENREHEMYYSKNWWTNSEYKGINTRWITQDGQRFEVQFHTPDSYHAKHHVTHIAYERIRDLRTSRYELGELHAFQSEVCSRIRAPNGAADIPDYRKEGF